MKLVATATAVGFPKFALSAIPGWKDVKKDIPLHRVMRFSVSYDLKKASLTLVCQDSEGEEFKRHFKSRNTKFVSESDGHRLPIMNMYKVGRGYTFEYSGFDGSKITLQNLQEVKRTKHFVDKKKSLADEYTENLIDIKKSKKEFTEYKHKTMLDNNWTEYEFHNHHRTREIDDANKNKKLQLIISIDDPSKRFWG